MSIAPLHGRPAPLLLVRKLETQTPRQHPANLRAAPLGTRARRVRRRRMWGVTLGIAAALLATATIAWMAWMWRG
ncbi:MAG: hypothetical protein HY076_07035 [Candidatus Eisenbacteria bacterium]|uniref:Uncharacterized protein n=1 Tax=Eiseniibacteriota bacterium TaxID=2212470 RepID=A0A9D6LAI5_UNCEI|nr:hypothetical protein [Candidatus Eisenbacteria bacterium]MBI3540010.1 hypothetical protein [Candidatus Eisenbacteria bacterium]